METPGVLTSWSEARAARAALHARGQRLVLTNGVFDLLHVGHLRYLRRAAALGDVLWVALNGDESVRRLKGPARPLVPWAERAELLAALEPVSCVLRFDEETAHETLRRLRPDVYAKGGDYRPETLPEYDLARSLGAEVVLLPLVAGQGSSTLIQRIVRRYGADHDGS